MKRRVGGYVNAWRQRRSNERVQSGGFGAFAGRWGVLVLLVVGVCGLSGCDAEPAAAPDSVPQQAQRVTVVEIVDGDTLTVRTAGSGRMLRPTTTADVRLLEIDTPETRHPDKPVQCYGEQATSRLKELLPAGSTAWVQRDQDLRDRYDRYLLYLWNTDGTFVNMAMVRDGYATAVLYAPNDRYWSAISRAEWAARTSGDGLWGACKAATPSPAPPANAPEPHPSDPEAPERDVPDGDSPRQPPRLAPTQQDRDCSDIPSDDISVSPGDPHQLDGNGDGIGCESG